MNKSESKYFNTAVKMDEAFLDLLQKKDFQYITVKEICEVAGVNRSTFYLHYETIGDLLEESLEYIQNEFFKSFKGEKGIIPNFQDCPKENLMLITPERLFTYLNFIKYNRQLYRAALERPAVFQADRTYKELFQHIFEPILERFSVPTDERHYRIIFYLKGISGVIEEWIKDDCKDSVDQMITVIRNCIPEA